MKNKQKLSNVTNADCDFITILFEHRGINHKLLKGHSNTLLVPKGKYTEMLSCHIISFIDSFQASMNQLLNGAIHEYRD